MHRTTITRILLSVLILPVLSHCASPDPEREANRLFVEAYQNIEQAREIERTNPVEAYHHYRLALSHIDRIIQEYSETQIAVNVTQQQTNIGEMTIGELRNTVPLFESRANALESFHELSLYLSGRKNDEVQQAEHRIRYAALIHEAGKEDRFREILVQISDWAYHHWNINTTDPVYLQLAMCYSRFGYWSDALEAVDHIQNREKQFRALQDILANGMIRKEPAAVERIIPYLEFMHSVEHLQLLHMIAADLFGVDEQDKAEALLSDGLPSANRETLLEHIDVLTRLSGVFAEYGAFESSRAVIEEIKKLDKNYADFALRDLSVELARQRKVEEALEMIRSFERTYFQDTSIARISIHIARNGRISDALEILDDVADDVPDKVESYIEIAYLLSDYGDYERSDSLIASSRSLLSEIDSPLRRSKLQMRIVDNYIIRNSRSLAAEALDTVEKQALGIGSAESMNYILEQILSKWIELGRPDRTLDLAAHFIMDHPGFHQHLKKVLDRALDSGYHDLSRSLAVMTPERHYYQHYLVQSYIGRNRMKHATELSYSIRNFMWRAKAISNLVVALQQAGNFSEAGKAASDALQTTERIRNHEEKAETLLYVASRLSAADMTMSSELASLTKELLVPFDI